MEEQAELAQLLWLLLEKAGAGSEGNWGLTALCEEMSTG